MTAINIPETAARLANIEADIADLKTQADELRAQLVDACETGATIDSPTGAPLYKVMPGRRTFSPKTAAETLDPGIVAAVTKQVIDGAKLKELSPVLWASCCTVGEPSLRRI